MLIRSGLALVAHTSGAHSLLPASQEEALSFSDKIKTTDSSLRSVSLGATESALVYEKESRVFGLFRAPYVVRIMISANGTRIEKPWWLFFAADDSAKMESVIQKISGERTEGSVAAQAARVEAITQALRGDIL